MACMACTHASARVAPCKSGAPLAARAAGAAAEPGGRQLVRLRGRGRHVCRQLVPVSVRSQAWPSCVATSCCRVGARGGLPVSRASHQAAESAACSFIMAWNDGRREGRALRQAIFSSSASAPHVPALSGCPGSLQLRSFSGLAGLAIRTAAAPALCCSTLWPSWQQPTARVRLP